MNDELGDYFKGLEKDMRFSLKKTKNTFIRLDGKRFHSFTNKFLKPYDPYLHYCLQKSLMRVIRKELGNLWACVYFQSDEASIIIPIITKEEVNLPFNGRIDELTSVLASGWSVEFYFEMLRIYKDGIDCFDVNIISKIDSARNDIIIKSKIKDDPNSDYHNSIAIKLSKVRPIFDCRFFQSQKDCDIGKYLTWRRIDAIRNMKNSICRCFYSQKQMENKCSDDVIAMLEVDKEIKYHNLPAMMKRGVIYRNDRNLIEDDFKDDEITIEFANMVTKNNKIQDLYKLM